MFIPFTVKVIYVFVIGLVLAVLEIQIEGKHGWAEKLPTWRPGEGSRVGQAFRKVTKKELTGYHLVLNIFLLLFLHLPLIWVWHWSWQAELEVLAFYTILTVFWDFLWFVLNPHHSLHDFNKEHVWWHRHWWGRFPTDYYAGVLATSLIFVPLIIENPEINLLKLIILIFGIILLTGITVWLYPGAYKSKSEGEH